MPLPQLDQLIEDLGALPDELRRQLRPGMRRAALPILQDARSRASWSTRIPAALRLTTALGARSTGVRLVVDSRKAPHARPYEHGSGRNRALRHPVFGNRDAWVQQQPRPFFFPAVRAGRADVVRETSAAVLNSARLHGYR